MGKLNIPDKVCSRCGTHVWYKTKVTIKNKNSHICVECNLRKEAKRKETIKIRSVFRYKTERLEKICRLAIKANCNWLYKRSAAGKLANYNSNKAYYKRMPDKYIISLLNRNFRHLKIPFDSNMITKDMIKQHRKILIIKRQLKHEIKQANECNT